MKNNDTIRSILSRRSYKAFRSDPIAEEDLETILESGKYAPTGMNRQPWHFTVVKSPQGKAMFKTVVAEMIKKRGPFRPGPGMPPPPPPDPGIILLPEDEFRGAPVLIIISGDAALETARTDCVCAMQNMFIAAASLGIMSGWTHMVVKDLLSDAATRQQFKIPPGYEIYAAAFFGYPLGQTKDRGPRKEGTVTYL